jgi:ABC-2 type transport system permease protein
MHPTSPLLPLRRIKGMLLRHIYALRASPQSLLQLLYWPILNTAVWGFLNTFLAGSTDTKIMTLGSLFGAALLWEFFLRGQINMYFGMLEEGWSRNIGHLFVSPLKDSEWMTSLVILGSIYTCVGILPAIGVAYLLFGYSLWDMGLPVVAFAGCLLMSGWWAGMLLCALVMRFGFRSEGLGWMLTWVFVPFAAPFYPVSVLPHVMQKIAAFLPQSYVFEAMRKLAGTQVFDGGMVLKACALNLLYILVAAVLFRLAVRSVRQKTGLLQVEG